MRTVRRPMVIMMSTLKKVASGLLGATSVTAGKSMTCRERFSRVMTHRLSIVRNIVPSGAGQVRIRGRIVTLLSRLNGVCGNICLVGSLSTGASSAVIDCNRHVSSLVISGIVGRTGLFSSHGFVGAIGRFGGRVISFRLAGHLVRRAFSPLPGMSLIPNFVSSDGRKRIAGLKHKNSSCATSVLTATLGTHELRV